MDIRTTENPVIRWAGRGLKRLNDRHPWNHNHHFHSWIVRSLPATSGRVLDVGCGRGDLVAALCAHAGRIDGIDPDQAMAYASATRFHENPRVRIWRRTLAEHSEHAEHSGLLGTYDAVTVVASLHHMDLDETLLQARDLLCPGGRLLVVTLVRPAGVLDQLWDVGNALANPLIGMLKHPRPAPGTSRPASREPGIVVQEPREISPPVREAARSLATLRERADLIVPGAVLRRREGFRVTLRWQKPRELTA
ncbi:class I SAM-dependent methyltransferase [Brachybacterium sp. GCM10030252]|uniref:class I SAM-dependent methyltransferase n=1 Tax=Brachybacterium sp. GCM10030252 TaxID=3273380 RepID=UPI00360A52EC